MLFDVYLFSGPFWEAEERGPQVRPEERGLPARYAALFGKHANVKPYFDVLNHLFIVQVEHKYQERTSADCPKLGKLHSSYTWLKEGQVAATAAAKGPTAKYMDPNYV